MIEQVTLDLLQLNMDIKQAQHKAHAANVANANIPGADKLAVDFSSLLASIDSYHGDKSALVESIRDNWQSQLQSNTSKLNNEDIKLDEESAQLLLASGKYKLLAESVSRKLGLMSVAVSGGKR